MTAREVTRFIKGIGNLSTIPVLLGKILSIIRDENASADKLYELIAADPALAERVLRIANSAFFGHSGEVKSIKQAILFLGNDRIKSIAVGMTVMDIFPASSSFKVENLWIHSYEVAFIAAALSDTVMLTQPKECFLSGLLHDTGRIILYAMDHTAFLKIETTDSMLMKEKEQFGCTHAEAGAWFLEEIGMPAEIVTTTLYHHNPSSAEENRDMVSVVALAEALSRRLSPRIEDDGIWTREHDAVLLELSVSAATVDALQEKLNEAKVEIESFFTHQ